MVQNNTHNKMFRSSQRAEVPIELKSASYFITLANIGFYKVSSLFKKDEVNCELNAVYAD